MKLSVITINYNNKEGLQKTIDSVISQTFKDFEWIIIDGGSTDGGKELIERYSQYVSYWVSEPDKGIYDAMNKGIIQSHGEYLQFLNSGDTLTSSTILLDVFRDDYNEDIVTGNIIRNGKVDRGIGSRNISLIDFYYGSLFHPASFIKKSLFVKYGMYDERYKVVSDWKFFLVTVILHNATIKYINKSITVFDANGISSLDSNIIKIKQEKKAVLEECIPSRILKDYVYMSNEFKFKNHKLTRFMYSLIVKVTIFLEK